MQHLNLDSLDTFAAQLDDSNRDTIALRNWQPGQLAYTYYHMDCTGPISGYNTNVNLSEIAPLCRCSTCGGNIHNAPLIDA